MTVAVAGNQTKTDQPEIGCEGIGFSGYPI
jgi:hypothetical protein